MSEAEHWEWAEVVEPTDYGRQRREAWFAQGRANAQTMMGMLSGGGQADHQADHDHLTRSKHGLYNAMTPQQMGQAAAGRQVTIGGEWGQARPLERNGHLAYSIAPAPARVYQSQLDNPGQLGESPLKRYMRGER